MVVFHLIARGDVTTVLRKGLKCGNRGVLTRDKSIVKANERLDSFRPARLLGQGISRQKCLYMYYGSEGAVHDIADGIVRPLREWVASNGSKAILAVRINPALAFVSDLDAYDTFVRALTNNKGSGTYRKLAGRYWKRILTLEDFVRYYKQGARDFLRTENTPKDLPKKYGRIEIMVPRDIAPADISPINLDVS